MRGSRIVACCIVLVGAGCGGSTEHTGGTGGNSAQAGSGGASRGGASQGGASQGGASQAGSSSGGSSSGAAAGAPSGGAGCGATPPLNGAACTPRSGAGLAGISAECSWGDDPRPNCRTRAACENGAWRIAKPDASCASPPKPDSCPAAPPENGIACSDSTLSCWYDDGTVCSCSDCQGGTQYPICRTITPPEWACKKPASGCPNPPPQAGSSCDDPNLQCGISCELPIRCENGAWQYGAEMCPICAAPDTPIATPFGMRPIAELRVGELVYSVDHDAIVAVPIARIGSTPVTHHQVLRVQLDDGAVLEISARHPLANGKPLSSLASGDLIDGQHRVRSIDVIAYAHERTFDILPASTSGSYFANGALLGSTLRAR